MSHGGLHLPSTDLLKRYSKELLNCPPLTADEERRLALASMHGDWKARDALIEHNLRFAFKMAARFKGKGMDLEDLVAEANIGLCMAADHYNPETFNVRFQTYAGYWIYQCIFKAFSSVLKVRVPSKNFSPWKMLQSMDGAKDLSDEELAAALGTTVATANALRTVDCLSFVSIDAGTEDSKEAKDIPDPEDIEMTALLKCIETDVRAAIEDLPEREKDIMKRYNGIGVKQESSMEIAKSYNLSQERIRQILKAGRTMLETRLRRKYGDGDFA